MPEEINRIVADSVATLLFAPTDTAARILRGEGHPSDQVVLSGDVMYDAALIFGDRARQAEPNPGAPGARREGICSCHASSCREYRQSGAARCNDGRACDRRPNRAGYPPSASANPQGARSWRHLAGTGRAPSRPAGLSRYGAIDSVRHLWPTEPGGLQKEAYSAMCPASHCGPKPSGPNWSRPAGIGWRRRPQRRLLHQSSRMHWPRPSRATRRLSTGPVTRRRKLQNVSADERADRIIATSPRALSGA